MIFNFKGLYENQPGYALPAARNINKLNKFVLNNYEELDWFNIFKSIKKQFPNAKIGTSYGGRYSEWTLGRYFDDYRLSLDGRSQVMEVLLYIFCLKIFYPIGYDVVLTKESQGDGGFDVAVSKNNVYYLITDSKGQHSTGGGIEVNSKMKLDDNCIKLLLYGPEYSIGEKAINQNKGTKKMQTDKFISRVLNIRVSGMPYECVKIFNDKFIDDFIQLLGIKKTDI